MGKPVSRAALGCAIALLTAQPAQAAMGCWTVRQTAAAKVKDLQSRLMVAALRCRTMRADVLAAYDDFVGQNRAALQAENGLIHARFETGYGKDADTYYDRFATGLANRYGGDAMSSDICDDAVATIREAAAAAGDIGRLVAIADRFGPAPELPGGACSVAFEASSAAEPYPMRPSAPAPTFADAMDRALADVSDPPRAPESTHARAPR